MQKRFVGLGVWDAWSGGGKRTPTAFDVDEQGAEPEVLAAPQVLAGLEAEQTSFLTVFSASLPTMKLVRRSGKTNEQHRAES
jgi:hypothetical protein